MRHDPAIRSRLVGINVPPGERIASVAIGGALAIMGARRHSLGGALLALVGGGLLVRGITGRCAFYRIRSARKGVQVRRAVTVQATPKAVYELWRDLRNLPRFMAHVSSIEVEDHGISRWVVDQGPIQLVWRAEIVEDSPARRLRWRSLPDSELHLEGTLDLREAPAGRGTIVELKLHYQPRGGALVKSALYDFLRTITALEVDAELARMRMLLETGELVTAARNPAEVDEKVEVATSAWQAPQPVAGG
jgi:uncharacterized membrane protein